MLDDLTTNLVGATRGGTGHRRGHLGGLAVAADFLKQPIIIAYILAGLVFGPHGPWPPLRLATHTEFIEGAGRFGLILLLFMLGIVLHPNRLGQIFRQASLVVAITSPVFFLIGFGTAVGISRAAPAQFPLTLTDAFYIGVAASFSSTLLAVKLLPTRRLHESAVGTLTIGILIMQDVLAIIILIAMNASSMAAAGAETGVYWKVPLGLVLLAAAFPVEQYILRPLIAQGGGPSGDAAGGERGVVPAGGGGRGSWGLRWRSARWWRGWRWRGVR